MSGLSNREPLRLTSAKHANALGRMQSQREASTAYFDTGRPRNGMKRLRD